MVIKPTVGRVVLYVPRGSLGYGPGVELAALVTKVWDDNVHLVNLITFSPEGIPVPRTGVYLAQEGVGHPFTEGYAKWMEYQIGQAKRHAV